MLLESEISTLEKIVSMPRAQDWRIKLGTAARRLRPWVPSAENMSLWVSDYAKICTSLGELNANIEHLTWMFHWEAGASAEDRQISRAIDQTVDRIEDLARDIDEELRSSVVGSHWQSDPPDAPATNRHGRGLAAATEKPELPFAALPQWRLHLGV